MSLLPVAPLIRFIPKLTRYLAGLTVHLTPLPAGSILLWNFLFALHGRHIDYEPILHVAL